MTTEKKDKLKQSIKSQAIKNPNTKLYFLVIMGICFGVAGMAEFASRIYSINDL